MIFTTESTEYTESSTERKKISIEAKRNKKETLNINFKKYYVTLSLSYSLCALW